MGRTNYLQSANVRCIHKSNSVDEAKRYLFCNSRRDICKSSSSSTASSRRMKFLDRRPPRTAIPETRKSDDIRSISQLIGHRGLAEQTIYFSRQDCMQGQSYLVQRRSECDKDLEPCDCHSGGARQGMVLQQLCSPCTKNHTFLITRCSGHRNCGMVTTPQPKVSTVSTSTDELYSSTGTIDAEPIVCLEPRTIDTTTCTASGSIKGTADASTATDMQRTMYLSEGTQSNLHLIGVGDLDRCLNPPENLEAATETERKISLSEATQSNLHLIGVGDLSKFLEPRTYSEAATDMEEYVYSSQGTQTSTDSKRKISSNKETQSNLHLIGVGDLSKFLGLTENYEGGTEKNEDVTKNIPKTPENEELQKEDCACPEKIPEEISIKYSEILEISRKSPEPQQCSSRERKMSKEVIPKTPPSPKKGSSRERKMSKEVTPKTPPSPKKGSSRERKMNKEVIPKTPPSPKKGTSKKRSSSAERVRKPQINRDVPKKIDAFEECIRKHSEHQGVPKHKKSNENVSRFREKPGSSRRASSIECITKSSGNKGLHKKHNATVESIPAVRKVTRDVVIIKDILKSSESIKVRRSKEDEEMVEPNHSIK